MMVAKKPELWGKCPHCKKDFKKKLRFRKNGPRAGDSLGFMPQKYCSRSCSNMARSRGGCLDKHGYKILNNGKRGGYRQPEHHAVMAKMIGRPILKGETVHHKNGERADNRPENLELWSSRHGKGQRVEDRIRDAKLFLAEQGQTLDTFGQGDVYNLFTVAA
jgi:hypothetical protein